MRTKTQDLSIALASCDYDVIALTETWLCDSIANSELTSDYTIYRCDRNSSSSQLRRRGGVLIAVKKGIVTSESKLSGFEQLEQVIVRISLPHRSLFVCCIYLRSNSAPDLYCAHSFAIQQILDSAASSDGVVVVGDYNLPRLRWSFDAEVKSFMPENSSSQQELVVTESILAAGLFQICALNNVNGNVLDLAFVNDTANVELLEAPTAILKIDPHHKPYVLCFDTRVNVEDQFLYPLDAFNFDFNRCNYDDISASIDAIDWSILLCCTDVDDAVSVFYEKIYGLLRQKVPPKRINKYTSAHLWWNAELRHLRNVLRKQRKRYFRHKTPSNKTALQRLEEQYTTARNRYFHEYLDRVQNNVRENPSCFWTNVNSRRRSGCVPTDVFYGNATAQTTSESVSMFAEYFRTVFNSDPVQLSEEYITSLPSYNIRLPQLSVSVADFTTALKSVDPSKGPGPDRLPPKLINACAAALSAPVCLIFNRSIVEGIFPRFWKEAAVAPVHKFGNIHNVENYRGISLLCCLAKVLEKLVLYAAATPIISEFQHGFVKKRSTTSNLMAYSSILIPAVEKRLQVDAVYIDFSKAFDKVPHNIAIAKLQQLGFPSWLTTWLASYLSSRSAFVSVKNTRSELFSMPTGVPQGSHLGPLIFVLFINDLCTRIRSGKLLYADDLKIFRCIASLIDCAVLQEYINKLAEWCTLNGIEVNTKKSKIISFGRLLAQTHYEYTVQDKTLDRVESIRDLGVLFDKKLTFSDHISATTAKAFAMLGFIRRNAADFDDFYALKTLYCALTRSVLEYAVQVWAPFHAVQQARLERVQKCFVRFALRGLRWNDTTRLPPYADRCLLLDLQSLESRRIFLQRIFIFDTLSGAIDCPELLARINLHVPSRSLRHRNMLWIAMHRTTYGQNNPIDRCCRRFNETSDLYDFNMSKNRFKLIIRNF